ncbi:MAG: glycoside hydrolase family 31 protein, partial [Flavobacteriaceae bacterium]|nr:glycoside hydrolase family 31 protein [Flavobacteriaceae bacterium]
GYAKDFPSERPFILMRSAYSGSQRFGLIPWSGDVNRSWGGLQSQPEIALQMGMQGLGYMHSDLGGFAGANLDDELYVRWLQYGVFQPIFRPHAQEEVASEPIYRSTEAMTSAKTAIDLRYKLLPYNYNITFQNHRDGTPLMRPLFFEDTNPKLLTEAKTYFWGDDFLISPVLDPEIIQQDVYFPTNSKWVDFYTEQVVQGGQSKSVQLSNAYIPTYVRAGAFIPMVQSLQTTDTYDAKTLDLHYYHDPSVLKSERQFYNDDGTTDDAYEKGMFELLNFESSFKKGKMVFTFKSDNGLNFMSNSKQINLIIHNFKRHTRHVSVNGVRVKNHKKTSNNQLVIPVLWATKNTLKIKIN